MALLTTTNPTLAGTTVTYAAVSSSDTFNNPNGTAFISVKNAGGGSINATIKADPNKPTRAGDGVFPPTANADIVVAVANGTEKIIGPILRSHVDGNSLTTVQFSGTTSVTALVIQPPA